MYLAAPARPGLVEGHYGWSKRAGLCAHFGLTLLFVTWRKQNPGRNSLGPDVRVCNFPSRRRRARVSDSGPTGGGDMSGRPLRDHSSTGRFDIIAGILQEFRQDELTAYDEGDARQIWARRYLVPRRFLGAPTGARPLPLPTGRFSCAPAERRSVRIH